MAVYVDAFMRALQQRAWLLAYCLALGIAPLASSSAKAQQSGPQTGGAPRSVLFVGNSFTLYNGGLAMHFKALAASTKTPRDVIAMQSALEGATLVDIRQRPAFFGPIRAGGHDLIVLQDDIPEYGARTVEPFKEQVRWFNQEIRAKNGRTVLFMAWPYERLSWASLATIAEAHKTIGAELGIPIAPIGLAFEASKSERPELAMLSQDREHQSLPGTYLAACVLYATIFRENPEGASYTPSGMSTNEAGFLQRVAWKTVSAWKAAFAAP